MLTNLTSMKPVENPGGNATDNPSSQPTNNAAHFYPKSDSASQNDPVIAILLICVAICSSLLAFYIFFRRFCRKRRIQHYIGSNAVGRFLVELRAASDEDYHDPRVVVRSSNAGGSDFHHNIGVDVSRSRHTTRYLSIDRICQDFTSFFSDRLGIVNEGSTVVEAEAVEVTSLDSQLVLSCSYDSEESTHSDALLRPGVFRVLEGNVFSSPSPNKSQIELQSLL